MPARSVPFIVIAKMGVKWIRCEMANGHGGSRRGAGRPLGRKTTPPRPIEIDPDSIDPRAALAAIVADPRNSAMSRVNACKALLDYERRAGKEPIVGAGAAIIERALRGMTAGRAN